MPTPKRETNVRISATVRRSVRDRMRYLATQRSQAGRPTSESRLWSEAGALYLQQALRTAITQLNTETFAQRQFLINLHNALKPILERLAPPIKGS